MIIWSGLGFVVPAFAWGSALFCNAAFDSRWGDGYYSSHRWTVGVAMLIAAALSWFVGLALRKRTDRATGREVPLDRGAHSLFFIPVQYWGGILGVIGVVLCVMDYAR